jgi:MFS family permease
MVQSFEELYVVSQADAAMYAGILIASFTFGEFLTGILWGKISDQIGRKPTLMIGVAGGLVSAAAFGVSKSFPLAMAARLFGGLINPNVGVVQTMIAEIVPSKNEQGM